MFNRKSKKQIRSLKYFNITQLVLWKTRIDKCLLTWFLTTEIPLSSEAFNSNTILENSFSTNCFYLYEDPSRIKFRRHTKKDT